MELGGEGDNSLPKDILHQLCSTIVQEIEEIRKDTLVDHEVKRKLVVYFMSGNGSKLLRCLIKNKECMTENLQHLPEVCFLCLQVLLYEPPPCSDYCPAATDRYLDELRVSGSPRTHTMSHNYMRSYCEMRTIKDKHDRSSNKKRKEKLQKLVLRHETVATSTSSSSDEGVSEHRPIRSENRRLKVIATPDLDEKPTTPTTKKHERCEPVVTSKTRRNSSSTSIKLKQTANSIVDACSQFPGFKCPCELAQVLLDMLVASFTSSLDSNPPPSHSPMSLAVQLVTAITVMQQSNAPTTSSIGVDDDKGQVSNDELICNISHKETRWSQQSVMHLRRLILRTVIELCNTGVRNHDFKEIAQNDILSSLLKLSSEMLERDYTNRVEADGRVAANNTKDSSTTSNKQQQQLPPNLLFASETMRGILLVLTSTFNQQFRTFDEMEPAVKLLHEFDWCGGYRVFTDLLVRVSSCVQSCSDGDTVFAHTQSARTFRQLLTTFEDLLSAVQNVKVSMLHRGKCSRQNHRSCDFLNLIPVHCDTMGLEISPTCSGASSKTCEDREACTVAVAVRFVINLMLKVSGDPCIGDVISTLDRVCLCRCQSPADWLVPLICCLPRWATHTQKAVLGVISKLMIYHFNDSTAHDQKKSTTVFCFPVSWVISILEQEKLYKTNESWKRTTPCKMIRTVSTEHHLNEILQLISYFFSANHKIDRWLSLSLYRILLQSSNEQLTSTILQHLQQLVPHGVKQARVGLLINVFLPIIGSFSGQSGRLVDRKVLYTREVFLACMQMTLRCLETEQHCKRLFVRHDGMQALNLVLKVHVGGQDKAKAAAECELNTDEDVDARQLAIEMLTLLFGSKMQLETRSALTLYTMKASLSLANLTATNNSSKELVPPSQPKRPLSAQNSLDVTPQMGGTARSFFRGFSFSWGGDKRRVMDEIKDRVVPVDSEAECHAAIMSAFDRQTIGIDEIELFRGESRKFVRSALIRIGRLPTDRGAKTSTFNMLSDRGATWAAKHLSRLNMHAPASEQESDSYMSETSGYRSTTAFDSLEDQRRPSSAIITSSSVGSRTSTDVLSTSEALTLPLDSDIECWRKLDECWQAISAAVCRGAGGHDGGFGVSEFFVEVGGVDASLKLVGNLTRRFSSLLVVASDDGNADDDGDCSDELLDIKLRLFSCCLRICFEFSKNPKKTTISSDEVTSVIKSALRGKLHGYEVVRKLFETILLTCLEVDQTQEKRKQQAESIISRSRVLTIAQRTIDTGGMSGDTNGCAEGEVPRPPSKSVSSSNEDYNCDIGDDGRWQDEKYLCVRHRRKYDASLDGYDGDSDSDALFQKCNDGSVTGSVKEGDDGCSTEEFNSHIISPHSDLLVHPQLLLLVIDLLGKTEHSDDMDSASTTDECLWNEESQVQTRRLLLLQLLTFVRILIKRKEENVDILCNEVDFASACLFEFQDVIHMTDPAWDDVRELLFSLCMTCNKKFMTSKHLRGILSLFNGKHPPLQNLVEFLDELSTHEEFGPNTCLEFASSSPTTQQSTSLTSTSIDSYPPSVWCHSMIRMELENRIPWPPTDQGVTFSFWIRLSQSRRRDNLDFCRIGEAPKKLHLISIGTKENTVQIWLEGTTLVFRVCVDRENQTRYPYKLLAQARAGNLLRDEEWQHLVISYTESKLPDKSVFGKVHLTINCLIESDIVLEFDAPPTTSTKSSGIWRHHTPASNTILFLGHKVDSKNDDPTVESCTKAMIGNTLVFSQPRLSLRSIYCLLRLGPKLNSLLECLADSISSHPNKDYRIHFRRDWSTPHTPPTSLFAGGKSNSPPPFLFQLLNQTTNPDQFFDEVIGADVSSNIKLLQETLVLTYSPNEPNVYYLYGVPATSTKRRMLFRRSDYHSNNSDFDSLTQSGSKHEAQICEIPTSRELFTFNRSLEQVGGIQVLLLLYAKVIELSCSSGSPSHQSSENFNYLESIQAKPLQTLLYLRSRDTRRRNEFYMENLAPMLHKVMTRDQCVVGFETLQLLFNNACSENVIITRHYEDSTVHYEINGDNSAVIHDIDLLNNFILDWRIWHKSKNQQGEEDFSVWTLLFDALNNLTGDFHPYQSFNVKTLLSCGVVDRILNGVQEIIDERKPLITDVVIAIVSFIRNLLGSTHDVGILSSVADFLIAVNCPEDTFVCHASKNFYFSLGRVSNKSLKSVNISQCEGITQPMVSSCNNVNATAKNLQNVNSKSGKSPPKKLVPDDTEWCCLNELDENDIEGKLPPILEDQSCLFVTADDMQRVRGPQSTLTDILGGGSKNQMVGTPDSDLPSLPSSATDEDHIQKLTPEDQTSNKSFESSSSQHKYLTDNGISFLMSELLNLLSFALHTGNENQTSKLIGGALNDEIMLVLCHHHDPDVRTATICLFYAYFSRCSQEHQTQFLKKKGFHLIANQLHQHPVNRTLVEACLYLLVGRQISLDEPYAILECGIDSHNPFTNNGAVLLLSILDKCLLSPDNDGVELCRGLLNILIEVFQNMGPIADVMLDNGLTLALCKLLNAIGDNKNIKDDSKQNLYHMVEQILTAVCVKSCSISGSGHFQVFEDLIVLLCSHEYEFILGDCKQPRHPAVVKKLTECLLFHIFDAMAESGGAIRKISAISRNTSMLSMMETGGSGTVDLLSPTSSDGCGTTSDFSNSPFPPFKPANTSSTLHRRGSSVGSFDFSSASVGSKHRPTSNLSMSRRTSSKSFDFSALANRSISGNFRSRSYRGNQRRKINEAESAQRLHHVLCIAVDRVVYSDRSQATTTNHATEHAFDLGTDMTSSVSSSLSSSSSKNSKEGPPPGEREYRFVLFDVAVDWLMTMIESRKMSTTGSTKRKSTTSVSSSVVGGGGVGTGGGNGTGGSAWERIIKIAQNGIIEQVARLLVYFLSPSRHIKDRTFPLRMARFEKFESLIAMILPQQSAFGEKVAVYLHLLLHNHKFSLTTEERADGKRMSKLVNKMGHRVSSQQRRAMHDSSEDEISQHHHFTVRYDEEWSASAIVWMNQMRSQYRVLASKTSRLAEQVSTCAMQSTRDAVAQQNAQRKSAMVRMKESISNDLLIRKRWIALLEQLAHERAVWYNPDQYPQSWQLDSTEGPCRERRRLQRCNIDIDARFMIRKNNGGSQTDEDDTTATPRRKGAAFLNATPRKRPLAFLFTDESHSRDSNAIRTRLQTNERIHKVQTCINVTCACETEGELLIGETQMHFVADQPIVDPSLTQTIFGERELLSLSWQHGDVIEYHRRWWQLRDIALEIFLINGRTYLLAFSSTEDRDGVVDELAKLDLPNLNAMDDIQAVTKQWCNGKIGNFEYLTKLNKEAGRSFNDLMQYPVAPFVLSDYTSQIIDLENVSSYRILEKPISVQDASREKHFRDRYKFLDDDYKNCPDDEREMKTPPFHYGSHYSNSGTVLHFLVRLPPFTQLFLEYQDSSFDIPDRTFHSMETTYRLSSFASTTDVKELIPEFFFLPEFLCNLEGFDFGYRQCGVRVHHVTLPIWSKEDPRLFVLIHRQALESDHVTANLHKWIDLVFGHKQTGQAALDAVNVFHPATYFGMDPSTVTDPLKRVALETMVKTYGQTPKMLFPAPHPPRVADPGSSAGEIISNSFLNTLRGTTDSRNLRKLRNLKAPRPLSSVKGLKWGDYVGSVGAPEPTVFLHKTVNGPIGSLVPLQTNDVCALAPSMTLLVVYARTKVGRGSGVRLTNDITWSALLTYDKPDGIIRLKLKHNSPGINLMRLSEDDNHVTCCAVTRDCTTIVFGTESGKIVVHRAKVMTQKNCDLEILPSTSLYCHSAAITDIHMCDNFRFFVSASMDGTAAIWDVDTLAYVRSLTGHAGGVNALAISRTSGDICTVCDSGSSFHIRLWTINGSLVAAQDCRVPIRCVTFSNMEEGRNINVVAGGLENGTVRLWSTWDLSVVRDVTTQSVHQPIVSVAFTNNGMVLYAATQGGFLVGWCRQDKEKEKQPLLITFLDTNKNNS